MPEQSDNPFSFWNELKRRKVFRVIVMYAGATYIIIELVNNVTEPLHLPEWTATLVILLLIIGFPIVAILSWIFDITPEGVKRTEPVKVANGATSKTGKRGLKVSDGIIAVLIVVVCILLYPKIFMRDKFKDIRDEDGKISVAVMPFTNMTGDSIYNRWQNSFQNLMIGNLSNTDELSVRPFEVMMDILGSTRNANYASITPTIASELALKLESSTLINGSLSKAGQNIRISVHLVKAETQEIYKSFALECMAEDEFHIIADSLSGRLIDFLKIEILKQGSIQEINQFINTNSPEAYSYYVQSMKMMAGFDINSSLEYALKAVEIDSSFINGYIGLSVLYNMVGDLEKAKDAFQKADQNRDKISFRDQLYLDHWKYGYLDKDPQKGLLYLYQLAEMEPQNRFFLNNIGDLNRLLQNYDKEIEAYEKFIEIDKKWGTIEKWFWPYIELADAYHIKGNHKRENELYKMVLSMSPDNPRIIYRQARCALSLGDTINANKHIDNYITIRREQSRWSEARIKRALGDLYDEADILDNSERYYREAIDLDPQNPTALNNFAWCLIDNDINIEEGLRLVNKALNFRPENNNFLHTKGVGLYKKGMYKEALTILEKSWDNSRYYDNDHAHLIQEIKQILAKQNSNE